MSAVYMTFKRKSSFSILVVRFVGAILSIELGYRDKQPLAVAFEKQMSQFQDRTWIENTQNLAAQPAKHDFSFCAVQGELHKIALILSQFQMPLQLEMSHRR